MGPGLQVGERSEDLQLKARRRQDRRVRVLDAQGHAGCWLPRRTQGHWREADSAASVADHAVQEGDDVARELPSHCSKMPLLTLLLTQGQSKLTPDPLPERPHYSGGVSALTLLPGSRLTFATGGQDKTCVLFGFRSLV